MSGAATESLTFLREFHAALLTATSAICSCVIALPGQRTGTTRRVAS